MKELLLGNEAMARGAVEAGVQVYSAYPGTPSSELTDAMSERAKRLGFYMEYSTNEKVAMEVAAGAAIAGVRSMTAMKHVGLNVAADPFMSTVYVGVRAGMVIVTADDPNCRSSQNEQDNRRYARLANVPMIEPSDPNEAHKLVKRAFEVSEKFNIPVLIRTTTRLNHMRAPVEVGEIPDPYPKVTVEFKKDPFNLVPIPAVARKLHKRLLEKIVKIREFFERVERNRIEGSGSLGIIASGTGYNYASDVVKDMEIDAEILKLTTTRPLPKRLIEDFLSRHDEVLIVEEVDPFLETNVRAIAHKAGLSVKIYGKGMLPEEDSVLPSNGELRPEIVAKALERITGKKSPYEEREPIDPVPRPPIMCPGCPHRATYYAARRVFGTKAIASSDIGCYTLGIMPPYYYADTLLDMGSSVGMAGGLRRATNGYVIAFIGDSTFFHAGMPGLANLVYNKHKALVVVMDNRTTAMTGHQPHPGIGITGTGEKSRPLMPEDIAKAMGIEFIRVVNPHNIEETTRAFKEAKEYLDSVDYGVAFIVSRAPCALLEVREKRRKGERIVPYRIDPEKCIDCGLCYKYFNCPAIIKDGEKPRILPELCVGCGDCARICPKNAIEPMETS